jgi:hypothetical protein
METLEVHEVGELTVELYQYDEFYGHIVRDKDGDIEDACSGFEDPEDALEDGLGYAEGERQIGIMLEEAAKREAAESRQKGSAT